MLSACVAKLAQVPAVVDPSTLGARVSDLERLLDEHTVLQTTWHERADSSLRRIRQELRAIRRAAAGRGGGGGHAGRGGGRGHAVRPFLAPPPPAPPRCTSTVVLRREVFSLDRCVPNVTFGCATTSSGHAAMFVKGGCRGTFWCNGNPSGICGMKGKRAEPLHGQVAKLGQTCSCSSNVTLRDDLNDQWKWEARERARAEREAHRIDEVRPGDSLYASRFRNACVAVPSTSMMPSAITTAVVAQVANGSVMMPRWHWTNAHKMPPPNNTLAGLYWLHMPKAGTALVATIVRYACPETLASIYKGKRLLYPDGIFKNWFDNGFVSGAGCSFDWAMRQRCAVNPRFTWYHTALPWDDADMRRSQFNVSALVVMMRRPIDRLVSAYAYRLHGLAWANNYATHRQRRLIEKVAAAPPIRLHSPPPQPASTQPSPAQLSAARAWSTCLQVAPSPILFYALHSCGVQARLPLTASDCL